MNTNNMRLMFLIICLWGTMASISSAKVMPELSKADWLMQMKKGIPVPICKSFMRDASIVAQMKINHLSYDQCLTLIPVLIDACAKKYDGEIPTIVTHPEAQILGKKLGECVGDLFASNYLKPHSDVRSPVN